MKTQRFNMLIKKSTKRKLKKRVRVVGRILLKAYLIFAFLYLIWHLGRYYEYQKIQKDLAEFKAQAIKTYYFVDPEVVDPFINATSELYVTGELNVGYCVEQGGIKQVLIDTK